MMMNSKDLDFVQPERPSTHGSGCQSEGRIPTGPLFGKRACPTDPCIGSQAVTNGRDDEPKAPMLIIGRMGERYVPDGEARATCLSLG